MHTFQWQDNGFEFEEENVVSHEPKGMTVEETNESIQLKKYQDPSKDEQRQSQLAILNKFGTLFANGDFQGIAQELLTEDFEIFIFNSTGRASVRNAHEPQGFIEMFKDVKIYKRDVRETDIDSEKSTACQICRYKITYKEDSAPIDEVACEIFSIRDGKISKYRASFGNPILDDPNQDPLEPTRKEKMLAKVKQINYALAGQPDFEKVGSLLGENIEFKIWRWDDLKCFTISKSNFICAFKEIQENMSIRCIVPYEFSADTQGKYVTAMYVYHLENNSSGQRYDWLSQCVYGFDDNDNIFRASQQGELYPEGEAEIPFEVHSREKLEKTISSFTSLKAWDIQTDFFDSNNFLYDCMVWTVCFACPPGKRCFQGFKQIQGILDKQNMFKDSTVERLEAVDIFVDQYNKSHDVVFAIAVIQGTGIIGEHDANKKSLGAIMLFRLSIENGKFAKAIFFMSKLEDPIESPFDNKSFQLFNNK